MPIIDDPRYTETGVVGRVNSGLFARPETAVETPPLMDTIAAAARQSTLAGAAVERILQHDPDMPEAPPGWDPLNDIAGYEDHAGALSTAQTPSHLQGMKDRIRSQRMDQDVLQRAGWGGKAASFVGTVIDPSFLASIAVPEIGLARMGAVATAAARGAAAAGTYEAGMHQLQDDRTAKETLWNVGGAAVLSGVLGHILHSLPTSEYKNVAGSVAEDMAGVRSEAGAAAVSKVGTLSEESIARGGATLSKVLNKTPLVGTDLDVVMNSDSPTAHNVLQQLADVTPILNKNREGIATPTSVESFVGRHEARVADFVDEANHQWADYKREGAPGGLNHGDFYTQIAAAARSEDFHAIPQVQKAAQFLRSRVFDPLKNDADSLGMFGENGPKLIGAPSYFRRMYDREAIRANLAEWHDTLFNHFSKEQPTGAKIGEGPDAKPEMVAPDRSEITAAVEDVTKKILGNDIGQANFATKITVGAAGPLKERTLDIPDNLIEKFLVNDPLKVARAYVRELAPQVEMTKRFGDVDMKQQLQNVGDEYNVMRDKVRTSTTDAKAKSKKLDTLNQQEKRTQEALIRVRDRVLGRAGRISPDAGEGARKAVAAARGWRNWVASAKLGGTAITGGAMDTARIASQYGFLPTISKLTKLVVSPAYRNLSMAQARRVGSAVEVALSRRVNIATDGARTDGWTEKMANGVYKWTGLSHTTDFNRTLAATLFENQVLKASEKVAAGGTLPAYTRARLASLGLGDDELARVAQQVAKFGGESSGTRISGSADWTDKDLSDIYDAAILKESKIVVQQPGAADRVWWLDKELGKFIGQLKTFSLSTPSRLLTPGLQMAGANNYLGAARFIGYMMIGGYLTHALRQTFAGKAPVTDPIAASNEALAESGLLGVLPDIVSPIGRRLGIFGESVRYSDRNVTSAFGGPAVGALTDAYDFAMNRTQGGMSASDLHMLRRMLPYNNVWWLRRGINALEGEVAEGLDLKGADSATFGERMLRTDAVLPQGQRGGTGTGQLVQ